MPCSPYIDSPYGRVFPALSTSRPTGSALYEGLTIYETDTDKLMVWNGVNWNPPWNQPWGIISDVTGTVANQTGITTNVVLTGCTTTFTAVANRRYMIQASAYIQQIAAAGSNSLFIFKNAVALAYIGLRNMAINENIMVTGYKVNTPGVGSVTYDLRMSTSAGTASNLGATIPPQITVWDIGPNGVPA